MTSGFTYESAASPTVEHYTPPYIFEALGKRFTLDPCHPEGERLPWVPADRVLTRREDGLATPWAPEDDPWVNPPYCEPERKCAANCKKVRCVKRGYHLLVDEPGTIAWVAKVAGQNCGMMLLFARTDVAWFHQHAVTATLWCFLEKRVKFVGRDGRPRLDKHGKEGSPGAGSLLLAWGDENAAALEQSGLGVVTEPRGSAMRKGA